MATNIQITDLTSTTSITQGVADGTGVFDKLMNSVNLYLDDQYRSGRLKGTDYANVLLGSMQTVLAQSVQFALQEKLLEAQIDDARKGIEVKEQQLANMEDELLTAAKQRTLLDKDADIKDYQRQFLQPAELEQLEEQLNVLYVERVIKDKQAAELGLDRVVKDLNASPEAVYTPKYKEL